MQPTAVGSAREKSTQAVNKQIRGSGLLLSGNGLSVGLNFIAQFLIVRHLSTSSYGEWIYALSIVTFCQGAARLGMREVISRFVPIYQEHEDHDRMFGVVALALIVIVVTSAVLIGAFFAFPQWVQTVVKGRHISVLLILIFLVPVDALDNLLTGLFASFARPWAIFMRRHVVAPGMKLAVVFVLIATHGGLKVLAYGNVLGTFIAVIIFAVLLRRVIAEQAVMKDFCFRTIKLPLKEVMSFAMPLITADMVLVLNQSAVVLLLGYFHGMREVAFYRVVLPAAMMNSVVMTAFATLYTPSAARMFAKSDHESINQLYWRTAVWMSVLTFPIFAVTFCFARPVTTLLYGARYADAAPLMAMLSLGYYMNTALGFNGLTLKVIGRLRYVVIINAIAAAINIILALMLVPRYGATGGAAATMVSLLIHNALKQAGLRYATGISIFGWNSLSVYSVLTLTTVSLFALRSMAHLGAYLSIAVSAAASLTIMVLLRKNLRLGEIFPEALRFPLMRRFFA